MKGLLIAAIFGLGASSMASANTTSMTLVLDPLRTLSADLEVPELTECTRSGATIDIRKCKTPGASFAMNVGTGSVRIDLSSMSEIVSTHRGHEYVETYYKGTQIIADKEVPVSIQLRTKDGVPFIGQLILNSDQVFTLVYE